MINDKLKVGKRQSHARAKRSANEASLLLMDYVVRSSIAPCVSNANLATVLIETIPTKNWKMEAFFGTEEKFSFVIQKIDKGKN